MTIIKIGTVSRKSRVPKQLDLDVQNNIQIKFRIFKGTIL